MNEANKGIRYGGRPKRDLVKLCYNMPVDLLAAIDKRASELGVDRTTMINLLCKQGLKQEDK